MTSSLVGSEMCIRDRLSTFFISPSVPHFFHAETSAQPSTTHQRQHNNICLLYTSDAADDM
eukprot:11000618-Prorocentrum_lima.AAC.1